VVAAVGVVLKAYSIYHCQTTDYRAVGILIHDFLMSVNRGRLVYNSEVEGLVYYVSETPSIKSLRISPYTYVIALVRG
jgi:hypothetical protein